MAEGKTPPIEGGYFLVAKLIFESPLWMDDPHLLKLFLWLIGKANYSKTPKKYPFVTISRGELVTSLERIADGNEYSENNTVKRWSKSKTTRLLEKLKEQEYIKLTCDTYGTHITICNYERYQNHKLYACYEDETPMDASETTWNAVDEQVGIINEGNESIVIPPIVPQITEERGDVSSPIGGVSQEVYENLIFTNDELTQKIACLEKALKEKKKRDKTPMSEEFLNFYQAYPKQVARGAAWKAWCGKEHMLPDIDTLLGILDVHKDSHEWQKENGKYIPSPAKWIKDEHFLDVLSIHNHNSERHISPLEKGLII